MVYLRNETAQDIEQMFNGSVYHFPAGQCVAFEDRSLASWFESKLHRAKSPADGRAEHEWPLRIHDQKPEEQAAEVVPPPPHTPPPVLGAPPSESVPSDEEGVAAVIKGPLPPEPMPAPPSTFVPPSPGHAPGVDEEVRRIASERAMSEWPMENIIRLAKKHGVYKKGEDKPRVIAKLLSIGFKP